MGTLDGANIEIRDNVGAENFFLFGLTESEVKTLKAEGYDPQTYIDESENLKAVIDMIDTGFFSPDDRNRYKGIVSWLRNDDPYMLCADFDSYIARQKEAEAVYRDKRLWAKKAIINIANMGFFSSDRTIRQYADEIWNVQSIEV